MSQQAPWEDPLPTYRPRRGDEYLSHYLETRERALAEVMQAEVRAWHKSWEHADASRNPDRELSQMSLRALELERRERKIRATLRGKVAA